MGRYDHLQLGVVDILAVERVAVAPGTGVDADVLALLGGEAVEHQVVDLNKPLEHLLSRPRVAGIVLAGESALCPSANIDG